MAQAKLGDKVRCKVTGFTGILTAITEYMTGCCRAGVQPPVGADGKMSATESFDLPMLEVVESSVVPIIPTERGGPRDAPQQKANPR